MLRTLALLFLPLLAAPGCARCSDPPPPAPTAYTPPSTTPLPDGWEGYVDPPEYTPASAVGVAPGTASPEAAVVHFYAACLRGDERFREVLAPPHAAYKRIDGVLSKYAGWKFHRVRLVRRKAPSEDRSWIKIFMEIEADGRREDGTDDVEVHRIDGRWFVWRPPT